MELQAIETMIEKARTAQEEFENYTQEEVDLLVKIVAKTVFNNAEQLAALAVAETGMGVYEDKVREEY